MIYFAIFKNKKCSISASDRVIVSDDQIGH